MKQVRKRLTYANVVSTLALFLVVAGSSAIAANQLAKNSVGTKQLKANAVTTAKIKNGAVTGAKIKAGSLGTVPSAAHANTADTATSSQNAATLGGVAASRYVTPTSVLQSGQTETGVFGANQGQATGWAVAAINFIPKLPAPLDENHVVFVSQLSTSGAHCPGQGKADPGYLCAYGGAETGVTFLGFYVPSSLGANGASVDGTTVYFTVTAAGAYARGTWAYTAP